MITIKVADEIPEIKNLDALDLIKIDVEGFENHVLLGLKKTIEKFGPRIIFEYDSNYWLANRQNIADCFYYLQKLSYTLYQITITGCELIKTPSDILSGNLFCISNKE